MTDLRHRLSELDQLDPPDIRASIDRRTRELRSAPPKALVRPAGQWWRGPLIAVSTAVSVLVVVAVSMLVLRTTEPDIADESVATQTTIEAATTTTPPSVTTNAAEVPVDSAVLDWSYGVHDVEIASDGLVYAVAPAGIATLDDGGEWALIDLTGLPEGNPVDVGMPVGGISQIALAPDGTLWVGGTSWSTVDDEEFGGVIVDTWDGQARTMTWLARHDCDQDPCSWSLFDIDGAPGAEIGDVVVSADGTVFASLGENLLLTFDGTAWERHTVPGLPTGWNGSVSPWSSSLAIDGDGILWAGTNAGLNTFGGQGGRGLFSFDGTEFTRYADDDGLPGSNVSRVAAAPDGTIWAVAVTGGDTYDDGLPTLFPDISPATIARFDGTVWTWYTAADGLLCANPTVVVGPDGTVVVGEDKTVWTGDAEGNPPIATPACGYARFDGTRWIAYPGDVAAGGFPAAVGPDGTLWKLSDQGLISFDGTTTTVYPSPFTRQ